MNGQAEPKGACALKRRPNVIFVLTDDQGYGDLSCHGNPVLDTPNLDAFYRESARFTDFHVGPTCAPTRASLMTGHYANSTGVWHTIGGRSLLREGEWTLASALGDAGYRTGIFGKWHLGDAPPYRPQDRGFDTTVVHGGGGVSQTPDYWGNDYFDDTYLVDGVPRRFSGYCTDVWFSEALRFIDRHRAEPFFCYIATNAPHGPYNVEDRYADRYRSAVPEERARFYGMIANIDENFGRLRAKLDEWGLAEDTILVFMTDNGSAGGATLDSDGFLVEGYNAGRRGKKGSPYEGGHRVPFFMRWPARGIGAGRDVGTLASCVDFMPTLLDLCGVDVAEGHTFHGRSLAPLLDGTGDWPDRAVVTDSQRLVRPVKWRLSCVMRHDWRLINGKALFDIEADPEQRSDVSKDHKDLVERLRKDYEIWWDQVSSQFECDVPMRIGEGGSETRLTCHDWRNEECNCPWNQGHIREGMEANGYWELDVAETGRYRFELRRWPREGARAIASGIEGDDVPWCREWVAPKDRRMYTGGKSLPVTEAFLTIQGCRRSVPIGSKDHCVVFEVELEKGPAYLETAFSGGGDLQVGAYYVYVRRIL